jgi:site-specific recombinase XerD
VDEGVIRVITWQEASRRFLQSLDVSPNTVRTYREALKSFTRWLNDRSDPPLDANTLKAYREWLKAQRAANTVLTYWVALRRFFQFAVAEGLLDRNPLEGMKGLRRPQGHLRRDLTRAELRAVFETIDRSTELGKRDFAMINLMVRGGLRVIEVQRANVGDLETRQGRKILRIWGKGRDERDEFVVLTGPAEQALLEYLACRGNPEPEAPLFARVANDNDERLRRGDQRLSTRHIRRRITHYLEQAGVKTDKTTAHSLRHSFVTLAIEGGASLVEAQAAARHRSIQTTMIYFHEHGRLENPVEDRIEI